MSKNFKGNKRIPSIVSKLSKYLNKKGKLKGSTKKETRKLTDACVHHKVNKKGKLVPSIKIRQNMCHCTMCQAEFEGTVKPKKEAKEIIEQVKELINQDKYAATAIGAGEDAINYFSQLAVQLGSLEDVHNRLAKICRRKDEEEQRKKNKKNRNGSESFGDWTLK